MRRIKIDGSALNIFMEDSGHPGDEFIEAIEHVLEDMQANPGGVNQEITLVIVNDFEPDEEESEDDESEAETETEAKKEI